MRTLGRLTTHVMQTQYLSHVVVRLDDTTSGNPISPHEQETGLSEYKHKGC